MLQRLLSWLFVCAIVAAVSLHAQAPAGGPTVTGGAELVLVAKVTGTVTKTLPGQAAVAIKQDDRIEQKAKINTGLNSSVVLVFSNGATTQLGADTELVIEEYLQDPFADTVKVADMTDEPSASRTKLALNRGELVGNVKKLKYDKGSSFIVQTPVGAAGIRGTTFRIVFRPTGTGQAFNFTLSTAEGSVAFAQGAAPPGGGAGGGAQGAQGGGAPGGGAPGTPQDTGTPGGGTAPTASGSGTGTGISVPQGQEIVLNVTVTTTPSGQMVVTMPTTVSAPVTVSQQTMQQVQSVAVEIAVAVQQAVFTPPPPAPTTPAGGANTNTQGSGNSNTGNSGGGNSGGSGGGTGGTTGSTGGTSGSTTGSTSGSTTGTTTTTTTTSAARGGSATTTTTTTPTGSSTSTVTGQTATGQNFNATVQATPPPAAAPPRIIPTTP